ncbi:hypothetical protein BS50DRAFT_673472 [Corynespora cassiicola Philippines]|uniref:VOC domain-containing protein n=1 Tax=Corynespora cassiicola Philippines TaxID=1448308 RepID=A0A2T2NZ49_CORCC|nr:hypothetical protein BS50DRAFT_673472 [Corynespora cassiicola Philippines]
MLDHVGITVEPSKFNDVVKFYLAALAPLGYSKQVEIPEKLIGLGTDNHTMPFWIHSKEGSKVLGYHFAFRANSHNVVDEFHARSLQSGGTCNGKPGTRLQYHPTYYSAFVIDPVGNNVEVVNHGF